MNVVFNSADLKGCHFVFFGNATYERPNALLDFQCEPRVTVRGGEDYMIVE
jgi:hypothetical protein